VCCCELPCLCCSIWWQFIPYFLVGVSEVSRAQAAADELCAHRLQSMLLSTTQQKPHCASDGQCTRISQHEWLSLVDCTQLALPTLQCCRTVCLQVFCNIGTMELFYTQGKNALHKHDHAHVHTQKPGCRTQSTATWADPPAHSTTLLLEAFTCACCGHVRPPPANLVAWVPVVLAAVSEGMRSLGTSVYLLTVAVGTYLASALNIIVAAASPHDLWVSDNPLFGHYDW
jgi:hypothetical protein